MLFTDNLLEGLQNLCSARLRSLLALLGVLVGTASVVAMVSGGQLATHAAMEQFRSLGTDLLAVSLSSSSDIGVVMSGQRDHLDVQQVFGLAKADQAIVALAPYSQLFNPIYYQGHKIDGAILGVTDSFASLVQLKLKTGRMVSLMDQYAQYCVLGQDVYSQLKQHSLIEPIGQPLQLGKHIFVVVGVLDNWQENSFVNANINRSILIPILSANAINRFATISNILFKLTSHANIESVEAHLEQAIKQQVVGKQVSFRSAKALIAQMEKQSAILTALLGLIGGISLIVGGIGVMNIMLVSVMERRREIGIRLAVGARRVDIASLFLIEAVLLSLVGGVLGVVLGELIAYAIALIWQWPFLFYGQPVMAGFMVSVAVGVFFGFYPAYLAARLNPIDALRLD